MEADRIRLRLYLLVFTALLVFEWLTNMRYLKNNYGYLLSLAMRVNPFDPEASAVVKSS